MMGQAGGGGGGYGMQGNYGINPAEVTITFSSHSPSFYIFFIVIVHHHTTRTTTTRSSGESR